MQSLIDFLKSMFLMIGGFVWDALLRFWDFLSSNMQGGLVWLMGRLAEILPENAQSLPSVVADYVGVANYYFPVSELFTILAIYLQFRLALLMVKGCVKLVTFGQG